MDDDDYDNSRSVFDGYCHRPFNKKYDGWRDYMQHPAEYEIVRSANEVTHLVKQLNKAVRDLWSLRELVRSMGFTGETAADEWFTPSRNRYAENKGDA